MSGSRLTRKVTVEGAKKIADTSGRRKSVFDRLGPGAIERSQSRRDDYSEPAVEKCRHWLKDGQCPFGNKCRYDHSSEARETKSKLKIIRSIVSKNEEPGDRKSVLRVRRLQSPEEGPPDNSPKKPTKRTKTESVKVTKDSLKEGIKEHQRDPAEAKLNEKRKEVPVRRSTASSGGWNLHDNSDSDDEIEGKQLDWEVRGAIHHAREMALEERRNDLRRQIANMDQDVERQPLVMIPNVKPGEDSSPQFQEDTKPEKKKKTKSDKSKKKMKKKSKADAHRMEGFPVEGEFIEKVEKSKKTKSSSGKKKKKHSIDSEHEMMQAEVPYRKAQFESEVFQHEYRGTKKKSDLHPPVETEQVSKGRHSNETRREKPSASTHFEPVVDAHHFDKRNRSPHIQSEVRPSSFERDNHSSQFERESHGSQYERESRQPQMDRESRQLEREARQYEREARHLERVSRQAQLEKESRQFERELHLRESHQPHIDRESRKAHFERESRQQLTERERRQFEKEPRHPPYERESRAPAFEREPRQSTFERESRQAQFERETRPPPFERDAGPIHSEKETRPTYHERAPRSPPFVGRSVSPPVEKLTRSVQPEWEDRPQHLGTRSPVMEKRHHHPHVNQSRSEEHIPRTEHREKQKTSKTVVNERGHENLNKEERVRRKTAPPQRSPSRENLQPVEEPVKEERKTKSRTVDSVPKEVKQKAKKSEMSRQAAASPILHGQEQAKAQRTKPMQQERKRKGPRTPSPEIKQSPVASWNPQPASDRAPEPAEVSQKRNKKETRPKPSQAQQPKEIKSTKKEKPVPKQEDNESVSESSDSDSSGSSGESDSEGVESVSGDDQKVDGGRSQQMERKKKTEPVAKEAKREPRPDKKRGSSRDHSEHRERSTEGRKEHNKDEARGKAIPEGKGEDRKEQERREDRGDKHYREHAKDHRRSRDDEPERRLDSRGSKDTRDARGNRDHRESRDYREFPRGDFRDPRDRERFHEFDERDRHHPFDARREYRDGPPEFGRGGWGRDMRGRDGYDGYEGRGPEYDERRGGPGSADFDRHYDRDRLHPDRGGRYREMEERHDAGWNERRGDRGGYRESERERHHEVRDRTQDDSKNSRGKRSRSSPEAGRGERKGHRKERKRGSGTPPEESDDWDYTEGHSPASKDEDQQSSSRKRPKEPSPARSDSAKRKKVSTPEQSTQDILTKPSQAAEKKEPSSKEDDKDSKKSKKDKGKKAKKRKLSDEETGTTEAAAGTPERKRVRETETNDKQVKKSKTDAETPQKPASDAEGDNKGSKTEAGDLETAETLHTEPGKTEKKSGEQVFSDWSDASEGNAPLDKTSGVPKQEEKQEKSEVKVKNDETKSAELDGSFEDVYDPISDDELEAIIADDGGEGKVKEKKPTLDIEDVDWSILGTSTSEKVSEPGDYIKRFSAGNIFSRIGISSSLAGPTLTKIVQEKCTQNAPDREMKDLLLPSGQKKLRIGALVAAEARRLKARANVVNDIGPCRRALCARRDFHIRKQFSKLTTTKLGSKLLLDNTALEPVDSELFALSVSIFRRGMTEATKQESRTQSPTLPETSEVLAC